MTNLWGPGGFRFFKTSKGFWGLVLNAKALNRATPGPSVEASNSAAALQLFADGESLLIIPPKKLRVCKHFLLKAPE